MIKHLRKSPIKMNEIGLPNFQIVFVVILLNDDADIQNLENKDIKDKMIVEEDNRAATSIWKAMAVDGLIEGGIGLLEGPASIMGILSGMIDLE
jgi:hypothetical protein